MSDDLFGIAGLLSQRRCCGPFMQVDSEVPSLWTARATSLHAPARCEQCLAGPSPAKLAQGEKSSGAVPEATDDILAQLSSFDADFKLPIFQVCCLLPGAYALLHPRK